MVPETSVASDAASVEPKPIADLLEGVDKFIAEMKRFEEDKARLVRRLLMQKDLLEQKVAELNGFLVMLERIDAAPQNGSGGNGNDGYRRQKEISDPELSHRLFGALPASISFETKTLADAGRIILSENDVLHGSEIERLAREHRFQTTMDSKNFQAYLAVSFKRDGGFVNLGKNRWQLKRRKLKRNI